ncbi:ion channel [Streptomyces sp. LN325]|uniref:ion channel n=1 Tax=Streptomyces sp. LN325 TaxID=3112976 RepID=UPI0037190C8D
MNGLWIALGFVILLVVFGDVFLATMNYREKAFLHPPVCALAWKGMRRVFCRLPEATRKRALQQVIGIQILLVLLVWLAGTVLGYGLIFFGALNSFEVSGPGLNPGPSAAFYYSFAQLATVGSSQLTPASDALRVLSIMVTFSGLAGVGLVIAFLLENFQVLRDLSRLSAIFSNLTPMSASSDNPVGCVALYYPRGHPVGLDNYLLALYEAFTSYSDGLQRHHLVYWARCPDGASSLAYPLHMLGGVIGALRWGLPTGTPGSDHPLLYQLGNAFEKFIVFLTKSKGWSLGQAPNAVDSDNFAAVAAGRETPDVWLARFLSLEDSMATVARLEDATDPRDSYARYREWLPFAYQAQQITEAVSRDLDHQPLPIR